jgi:REP element-mobilizing transposase RayT
MPQSDWVKEIKRVSSAWFKTRGPELARFAWQAGYGVFSVSPSNLAAVERYIATQEEHHRKMSFMDKYRGLLRKHGFACDERHVWD